MSELGAADKKPTDPVGRFLFATSRLFAIFGGIVAGAMAVMTTVSVTGRYFYNAPLNGDFELIAIGTGVTVFLFLPYCQMVGENVIVDFFLDRAPAKVKTFFDAVGSLMFAVIIGLMVWRTTLGGYEFYDSGESTLILAVPRWWTLPLAVLCLALLFCVCVYTFVQSVRETRR
jgi:TRAP-type C4-dicarboxylate transport system permease small subunit